jgi:tetratricopeptide (TPR) repeat protein
MLANYSQYYLVPMGRLSEAVAASRKALVLDPLSPHLQTHLGNRYWLMEQYDSSIKHYIKAIEIDPQYHWAHMFLGISYVYTGNTVEAVLACEKAVAIVRRQQLSLGILGWTYARAGQVTEACNILAELQDLKRNSYVSPSSFAWTCFALGNTDDGFDWMERAVDEHDPMVFQIPTHPQFTTLRSHPRYQALLRKMNLEP